MEGRIPVGGSPAFFVLNAGILAFVDCCGILSRQVYANALLPMNRKKGGKQMHLNPRDRQLLDEIVFDQRVSIQAAAYTVYIELTPNTTKPVSQREFHAKFKDNWSVFCKIERDAYD
jgi:hypothetical protein